MVRHWNKFPREIDGGFTVSGNVQEVAGCGTWGIWLRGSYGSAALMVGLAGLEGVIQP